MAPLGRLLEPDEVAFAVAFLAAPEAGAINGQTLILDGGGIQTVIAPEHFALGARATASASSR